MKRFEEKEDVALFSRPRGGEMYRRGIMQRDRGGRDRKRDEKLSEPWRIASQRTRQQSSLRIHSMENNICPLGCFICCCYPSRTRSQRMSRSSLASSKTPKRLSSSPFFPLVQKRKIIVSNRGRKIIPPQRVDLFSLRGEEENCKLN